MANSRNKPARSKKTLHSTIIDRTIKNEDRKVDPSAKKVVERKKFLKRQRADIDRELRALDQALNVMELVDYSQGVPIAQERRYEENQPFLNMALNEACLIVLHDNNGWMDKNEVEYMLVIGGYESDAKDMTNSVDVTLRKLATEDKCKVERARGGQQGNRYRAKGANDDVENSRTTA